MQKVSDTPRLVNKLNQFFVTEKDTSAILKKDSVITITKNGQKSDTSKQVFGITANNNKVDIDSKTILVMGPDPYFNNVSKDQWPQGKDVKLFNTELFQSINPFFVVFLTPLLILFFSRF